jgi:hypothetical protein
MPVRRWNPSVDGPLSEQALRAKLETLGYHIARHLYEPGTVFPDHTHGVDKIDAVVSGRFRMVVSGHLAVLGPETGWRCHAGSCTPRPWSATSPSSVWTR